MVPHAQGKLSDLKVLRMTPSCARETLQATSLPSWVFMVPARAQRGPCYQIWTSDIFERLGVLP